MKASIKALALSMALTLGIGCQVADAGWYSARGSAPIVNGDSAEARRNAIDDALRNAALQAGADISIEQVLENGTLLNDRMQIKTHSPIRRIQVIEDQSDGRVVSVLVKALIDDKSTLDCYAGNIKKTVLPFIFRYEDSEASLSAAGIETFDKYLTDLIYKGVSQSPALTILPPDQTRLLVKLNTSGPDYSLQRTLDSLSRRTQAQYVVVGTIKSLAKSETGNNALTKMIYNPTRTIRFGIQIYDVFTGDLILSKDYEGDAEWTFERGANIQIRSSKFSNSDYGQRAAQLAKYAIADIVSKLRCQIPNARIIQVTDDNVRINLGANANLKVGMLFNLVHRTDYQDRHNETYYQHNDTGSVYKVINVSPSAATLAPARQDSQLINVMLDDVVSLRTTGLEPEPAK